jgi:iron complex outermembrane receptor protein
VAYPCRTSRIFLLALLLLAGGSTALEAQSAQGTVVGQVTDATTAGPVQGARVLVVEFGRRVATTADGGFRIEGVPAGSYTLRVSALGYQTAERKIQVNAGAETFVRVALAAEAIMLEEMIVSARLRDEVQRQVPITQTVFGADELVDAAVDRPQEFLAQTPNASLVQSQNVGTAFITVRGISQNRNTETPVAIVVDDVLQVSPNQFNQALFDLERVEVLKGPQGALYGRNAIAGAILIRTKEATDVWQGYAKAGLGNGQSVEAEAAYGGPIVRDKLYLRLAGRFNDQEGFLWNETLDRKVDYFRNATLRGKLRWLATPNLMADLKVTADRVDGGSLNFHYQPALFAPDGLTLDPGNAFPFDFTKIGSDNVDPTFRANNLGFNELESEQVTLRLRYDLGGVAELQSFSSYNRIAEYIAGDQFPYTAGLTRVIGGFGSIDGTQTQFLDVEAWSQEFRVVSKRDEPFRWMAGSYVLTTDRFISTTTGDDLGKGITRLERQPAFSSTTNPTLSWLADDNDNEAWAGFANVAYDLLPTVELSAALRYDRDSRKQFVSQQNTAGVPGAVNRRVFEQWQPKFTVRFTPVTEGKRLNFLNLYGSWGVGFRSGQFNQNGVEQAAQTAGLQGVQDVIDAERARTFEAGFKSEWFDRRFGLSGALFHTADEGMPFFLFIGQVGAQVLVNIPESDLKGFDLQARARLADGLDTWLGVGYTDTEIQAFPVNPAFVGNRIPLVPEATVNVGAQWRGKLLGDLRLFTRVDYEWQGAQAWAPSNTASRSARDLLDFRVGIERGDWSLTFGMENATGEVYNSEFVEGGFAHPAGPERWRVIGRVTL